MGTFIKPNSIYTPVFSPSKVSLAPKHNIVFSSSLSDSALAIAKQLQDHKGLWLATRRLVEDVLPLGSGRTSRATGTVAQPRC